MLAQCRSFLRRLVPLVTLVGTFLLSVSLATAQGFQTEARAAYVLDLTSNQVLYARNAEQALPPASMSKLMTLLMAFEALQDGRLSLDMRVPVSEYAMSYGGSTMFLNTGDRPTVEELIRGVIVVSGNDASVALAEAISPDGTEAGYARMATARARELGMAQTTIRNASGWPMDGHVMSMRDLGILARELIVSHPHYYSYFAEQEFDYQNRSPSNRFNRNPLLGLGIGADGLKTGHTSEAGYGLVGSAEQNGRRIIFAIGGLSSAEARARESERIVTWAFRQFAERQVVNAGREIAQAEVFLGQSASVGMAPAEDLSMLLPAQGDPSIDAEITFSEPLAAPVIAGDVIGTLHVSAQVGEETRTHRIPLVATATVEEAGFWSRVGVAYRSVLHELFGPPPTEAAG